MLAFEGWDVTVDLLDMGGILRDVRQSYVDSTTRFLRGLQPQRFVSLQTQEFWHHNSKSKDHHQPHPFPDASMRELSNRISCAPPFFKQEQMSANRDNGMMGSARLQTPFGSKGQVRLPISVHIIILKSPLLLHMCVLYAANAAGGPMEVDSPVCACLSVAN